MHTYIHIYTPSEVAAAHTVLRAGSGRPAAHEDNTPSISLNDMTCIYPYIHTYIHTYTPSEVAAAHVVLRAGSGRPAAHEDKTPSISLKALPGRPKSGPVHNVTVASHFAARTCIPAEFTRERTSVPVEACAEVCGTAAPS